MSQPMTKSGKLPLHTGNSLAIFHKRHTLWCSIHRADDLQHPIHQLYTKHQLLSLERAGNSLAMAIYSDAGPTSGEGLTAGQVDGQGLLSRQAETNAVQPVCQVMWLLPINNDRLVWESVASWDRAQLQASLWLWQQQQHSGRQATTT